MLGWIEQSATLHQHTIAALGAISTFLAVLVSLGLALISLRSNRTRIKGNIGVSFIHHELLAGSPPPEYITVSITNVGLLPAIIPMAYFYWKVAFHKSYWLINPLDFVGLPPLVPRRVYPTEIRPRASETFFLSEIEVFRSSMAEGFQRVRFPSMAHPFYQGNDSYC